MEIHTDLPIGWSFNVTESHGTKPLYAVPNPYGKRGIMVGWNAGNHGHVISLTED